MAFLPSITKAKYISQLRAYVIEISYDNVFGDLVPTIAANALSISIRIFNIGANGSSTTVAIHPDSGSPKFQISIHRSNDHFSTLSYSPGSHNHPTTHRQHSWPMGGFSPYRANSHRQHSRPMARTGDGDIHRLQSWPMSHRKPQTVKQNSAYSSIKCHTLASSTGVHRLQSWPMDASSLNANASPASADGHRQPTRPMTFTNQLTTSGQQLPDQAQDVHRLQSWPA